jgi:3-phosphoshikimate 1-carboxyvinyltransferase
MEVRRPLIAEDTELFLGVLESLGWRTQRQGEGVLLRPPTSAVMEARLECGNAGTLLRFLTATMTVIPGSWVLDGTPRMRQRPIGPLVETLEALGARFDFVGQRGYPPVRIQ